jgi:hypothetical protein
VQLDQPEHNPWIPSELDGGAGESHGTSRCYRQAAQHLYRRRMPVGHRPEDERRDEGSQPARREGHRLDAVQSVGVEHRAERHEPHGQRRPLDEEEDDEFEVFRTPECPQHGARGHAKGGEFKQDARGVLRVASCIRAS